MKKRFVFLIMLLAGALNASPAKLALLGERDLCDKVMAELSRDDRFELLERAEIERVLREHQLQAAGLDAGILLRHFPHTDLFAVLNPGRLVVFNAKNGFRLWDGAPDHAVAKIIAANDKLAAAHPLYLSIVSLREVGVKPDQKPKIGEFVTLLEQCLISSEAVQMLERSRLDTVSAERELSGKSFVLTPSARLLTLEFEAGTGPDRIDLKVIVRDPANRERFSLEPADVLGNPPKAVKELSRTLIDALLKEQSAPVKAEDEAKRYFQEYLRLVGGQGSGGSDEIKQIRYASPKLFAALSLAPQNEAIRYAELSYYEKLQSSRSPEKRLPEARRQFERAMKFHADFPQSRRPVFGVEIFFGEHQVRDYSHYPQSVRQGYAELCREIRREAIAEKRRIYYPYDLADGILSIKELKNLHRVVVETNWQYNYLCDESGWLEQRFADYQMLYREAVKYLATHPEELDAVNHALRETFFTVILYDNQPKPDLPLLTEHLNRTAAWCAEVAAGPLDAWKIPVFQLDAMREALAHPTPENFAAAIDRYLERVAAFKPELLAPPAGPVKPNYDRLWDLRDFCAIAGDRLLPDQRLRAYQAKYNLTSEFGELDRLVVSALRDGAKDVWPELLPRAEAMRKYNLHRLKVNNFGNGYGAVARYIFDADRQGKKIPAENLQFFRELNSAFTIETAPYPGRQLLNGAAEYQSEVILLFGNREVWLREFSGQWRKFPDAPQAPAGELLHEMRQMPLALSAKYFVYAGSDRSLNILDRAAGSWQSVRDFFPEEARSIIIHRDRIYALAGDNEENIRNRPNYMLRCDINGANREILFSSERSTGKTPLDAMRGGLSGLVATVDGKLAFLLNWNGNRTQVWEYDIERREFRCLFQTPYSGTNIDVLWREGDGMLYLVSCGWANRLYRIDPASGQAAWIFAQNGAKRKNDPPADQPALFRGGSHMRGPWRVQGRRLWCGGGRSAMLDLDLIEANPPLLLLPTSHFLFELADGRMFFACERRYFIVKAPEK